MTEQFFVSSKYSKTLADMTAGSQCCVMTASEGNAEVQSRLYALGVYPSVLIEVLRFAPTGDPIQIRIGGTLLSIRKSEALLIQVKNPSAVISPEDQVL